MNSGGAQVNAETGFFGEAGDAVHAQFNRAVVQFLLHQRYFTAGMDLLQSFDITSAGYIYEIGVEDGGRKIPAQRIRKPVEPGKKLGVTYRQNRDIGLPK